MDLNSVTIAGRLTKDIDLRYTQSGTAVANFTLAVNRPFKNQSGEREADFINCVIWRGAAEAIANYAGKGDEIGGTGRIQTRNFEGQDGKRVFITELVLESFSFGQKRGDSGQNNESNTNTTGQGKNGSQGAENDPFKGNGEPIDIQEDDLPF